MVNKGNHRINSDSETIFRRFRNQISAIPQPKTYTLPQPKKSRFRNQKKTIPQPQKDDSATKKRRFRNQKPDSATKKGRFRNHHPRDSETKIRVTCGHTQHGIVPR